MVVDCYVVVDISAERRKMTGQRKPRCFYMVRRSAGNRLACFVIAGRLWNASPERKSGLSYTRVEDGTKQSPPHLQRFAHAEASGGKVGTCSVILGDEWA